MTIIKRRISGQGYKYLTRFSRLVLFKSAVSTMQKIKPVGCFNLCHWGFVGIHLFPVIWRKSLKSDFQSWRKNFCNDFAPFFVKWLLKYEKIYWFGTVTSVYSFDFINLVCVQSVIQLNSIYHFCIMMKGLSISFSIVIIVQDFETVPFYVLFVCKPTFSVIFCWMERVRVSSHFHPIHFHSHTF